MLLAAIPQNVNELGFICSPFQFPRLVQVLKGEREGQMKEEPQDAGSLAKTLRSDAQSLSRPVTGSLKTFAYSAQLSPFLSGKLPVKLQVPDETSHWFSKHFLISPGRLVSLPPPLFQFLLIYNFDPLYITVISLYAYLSTMTWTPSGQGQYLSILSICHSRVTAYSGAQNTWNVRNIQGEGVHVINIIPVLSDFIRDPSMLGRVPGT